MHVQRKDIDGLRAIAIILVVMFHAYPEWLPGGFVGVDVFFVISGFLITNLIIHDLKNQSFSFTNFYSRRIKRLFPGLILVFVCSYIVGWFVLLPHEYLNLAKDTHAGSIFFANFRLSKEAGYFDLPALQKPLLHLWSLAIEEQFYIVWPLLLVLAYKRKFLLFWITGLIALISFELNTIYVHNYPNLIFYLPYSRIWELLIGSALAYIQWSPKENSQLSNALTIIGLLSIFLAAYFIDDTIAYPGYFALLPTLGTFLVILAGPTSLNKQLLSHRYIIYIGLISYPLYLWHWPLLSFTRILNVDIPSWDIRALLIGISFLLAAVTYHVFEKPVRKKSNLMAVPLLILMIIIGSYSSYAKNATPKTLLSRIPEVNKIAAAIDDWGFPGFSLKEFSFNGMTLYEEGSGNKTVLFFGDSNMQQYAPRISRLLAENPSLNKKVVYSTKTGCPPIPHVYPDKKNQKCLHFVKNTLDYALKPEVTTIVIGAQWLEYLGSHYHYYKDHQNKLLLSEKEGINHAISALDSMVKMLRAKNKKVYVVLNIPVGSAFDPATMSNRSIKHFGEINMPAPNDRVPYKDPYNTAVLLGNTASRYDAIILDPKANLCVNNQCIRITEHGDPVYKDHSHLRPFYVKKYMTFIDQSLGVRDNP